MCKCRSGSALFRVRIACRRQEVCFLSFWGLCPMGESLNFVILEPSPVGRKHALDRFGGFARRQEAHFCHFGVFARWAKAPFCHFGSFARWAKVCFLSFWQFRPLGERKHRTAINLYLEAYRCVYFSAPQSVVRHEQVETVV